MAKIDQEISMRITLWAVELPKSSEEQLKHKSPK